MSEKKPHWLKPRWLYDGDCVICQRCRKAYDISTNVDRSIPTVCPFCGARMNLTYKFPTGGTYTCKNTQEVDT